MHTLIHRLPQLSNVVQPRTSLLFLEVRLLLHFARGEMSGGLLGIVYLYGWNTVIGVDLCIFPFIGLMLIWLLSTGLSGTVKLVKPEKKSTTEKKDKETKAGDKKSSAESKASSTKKKAPATKKAPKSAAAKKAALAKKQPSKQKTASKQNVKAPRKKSTSITGTTTKKATATRKKATAKA